MKGRKQREGGIDGVVRRINFQFALVSRYTTIPQARSQTTGLEMGTAQPMDTHKSAATPPPNVRSMPAIPPSQSVSAPALSSFTSLSLLTLPPPPSQSVSAPARSSFTSLSLLTLSPPPSQVTPLPAPTTVCPPVTSTLATSPLDLIAALVLAEAKRCDGDGRRDARQGLPFTRMRCTVLRGTY